MIHGGSTTTILLSVEQLMHKISQVHSLQDNVSDLTNIIFSTSQANSTILFILSEASFEENI